MSPVEEKGSKKDIEPVEEVQQVEPRDSWNMRYISIAEAGTWSEAEYQAKHEWLKVNGQENDLKELERVRKASKGKEQEET